MLKWLIPVAVAILAGAGLVAAAERGPSSSLHPLTVPGTDPAAGTTESGPCKGTDVPAGGYKHVVWIVMGTRSADEVLGGAAANVENAVSQCGSAANYASAAHPAVPNIPAMYAGTTAGNTANHCPCTPVPRNLFKQAPSWKVYVGGMKSNCSTAPNTYYNPDTNPPLVLGVAQRACARNDVPLPRLHADLAKNRLPRFTVIVPSVCQSMTFDRECVGGKQKLSTYVYLGDAWIKDTVRSLVSSKAYKAGTTAIFITWLTGNGKPPHADCVAQRNIPSCRVPLVVIAPSVTPGATPPGKFSHYSLLRTTQELLGISPPLGEAAEAPSMRQPFHL